MLQHLKAVLQLVRWMNLILLLILVWVMQQWVAVPVIHQALFANVLPWWVLLLLMLSTILIAAGGYVINDYFDIKIDRINRPDKVLVTTEISKQEAIRLHQVFTILGTAMGLVVAWWCRSWVMAVIMILTPGLLWFYSSSYKRQFVIGNLLISLLAALPPLLVAVVNIGRLDHLYGGIMAYSSVGQNLYLWLGGFALFAFLTTLMREMMKDMEDIEGDRELECHTLPVRIGDWGTKWVISVVAVLTIALLCWIGFCLLPYPHGWDTLSGRYVAFGVITPLIGSLWLMWAAKIPSDYHVAQNVMKFVMLMGMLYSFVIERCLCM